mmetsp:Transcript_44889/g.126764  ORF Transcript_44889/g.126764 Transcript_44889/m.126764 type:complete len:117 (+) Transcript_44889:1874-2224(+)
MNESRRDEGAVRSASQPPSGKNMGRGRQADRQTVGVSHMQWAGLVDAPTRSSQHTSGKEWNGALNHPRTYAATKGSQPTGGVRTTAALEREGDKEGGDYRHPSKHPSIQASVFPAT